MNKTDIIRVFQLFIQKVVLSQYGYTMQSAKKDVTYLGIVIGTLFYFIANLI